MQPSNNVNGTASQANGRKRPVSGRIVPAIPLPLSKPRQVRGQSVTQTPPQPPTQRQADVENGGQFAGSGNVEVQGGASVAPVNGVSQASAEVKDVPGKPSRKLESGVEATAGAPASLGSMGTPIPDEPLTEPVMSEGAKASSLQAAAPQSPAYTSPSSVHKSTQKFDMRPLRTELPPAFVPSATEQLAPQSATASAQQGPPPPMPLNPGVQNMNTIVFGGHNSSTSSPAPPHSAGSAYPPPPYPAFGNAQPPQYAPQAHVHHMSEPFGRPYAQSSGPPNGAWNMRQGYQTHPPWFQPHAHQQFRYPPREPFTPVEARQPNGHYSRSRSQSQASSAAPRVGEDVQSPIAPNGAPERPPYDPPRTPFAPGPPNLRHYHPGPPAPPPPMPQPDMASAYDNSQALRDHVLSQFASPAFADCHLQVTEDQEGGRQYLDGHKLILSRSPTLFDIIRSSEPPVSASLKTQVHVSLQGQYISIRAFSDCVRYLYGGPLLSLEQLRQPHAPDLQLNSEQRMELALQHIGTGSWLRLQIVADKAMHASASLINWDTIPALLPFALDGGLSPIWSVEDGSEDRSSTSSDDSYGRPDTSGRPTYDPYSTQLLHRMIDFVVHLLPPNFYVDSSAPQLATCPRLPSLPFGHEHKPSRSDPRLSKIRFGEMAADDHQRPSAATTTISSLLLSLPFALLKCILEHDVLAVKLGFDTMGSIMRQVIAEREVRRKRVLQARPAGRAEDAADAPLLSNLFWEEEVEVSTQHRAGLRLARRRRGIDTPPSSGAVSDQSK